MKSSHDPLRGRLVRYLMIAAKYGRLNYLSKRKAAPKTCSLDSFPSQGEPSAWEEDPLCIVIQRETMARAFWRVIRPRAGDPGAASGPGVNTEKKPRNG